METLVVGVFLLGGRYIRVTQQTRIQKEPGPSMPPTTWACCQGSERTRGGIVGNQMGVDVRSTVFFLFAKHGYQWVRITRVSFPKLFLLIHSRMAGAVGNFVVKTVFLRKSLRFFCNLIKSQWHWLRCVKDVHKGRAISVSGFGL